MEPSAVGLGKYLLYAIARVDDMIRKAVGTVLVLVVLMAGVGPVAAATGTAHAADGAVAGPNQAIGSASAQLAANNCSFPVSATDATGTNVTVNSKPQRIVTLNPSAAQTLWEIGAKDRVVGVSQYATYLDGADKLTNISGTGRQFVNTEKVVGLNPDLVLAPNTIPNATVETLRNAGVTVFKFDFGKSFEDIYAKTTLIGRLVGECDGATRIVSAMKTRVETVRQAVGNESTPGAVYLLSGGFVAGNGTFIGDVIETAGGENLAASAGIQSYKKISPEVVANQNPKWIVTSNRSVIPDGAPWTGTTAVQQNQTIVVNSNYISEPAPRVVLSLTEIARKLHPEAMQSANLSETPIGPANLDMGNATTQSANGSNATGATAGTAVTATTSGSTTMGATTGMESTTAQAATASGETAVGAATSGSETTAVGAATTAGDSEGAAGTGQSGNASGKSTSSNGPGFGVAVAAIALLGGALLARRR